ncbi:DUF6364 family protein [Bifidobacterium sp.]|jgi:hypothetical protein|uniref:DUF6364 family protein n=1 Tax=Bifidobacterium sp. TaxID=41200 RepID=UPI0025C0180C|nr:DUF6364 family protein [Bifidobacterium sp.]MCH4209695.1 DUF6364 family protein [Bifidobacterium sp.]MCI1224535.1 DUF6364 family protein [Bifidobacterium sp.]
MPTAKLTLGINERVVENGKQYVSSHGRTLSSIVEDYLESLIAQQSGVLATHVQALIGTGRGSSDGSDYRQHLLVKYSPDRHSADRHSADRHSSDQSSWANARQNLSRVSALWTGPLWTGLPRIGAP